MVKVSTLQAPISLSGLQGFQKSLYAKLKKAKTHDIILSSLGGFAAVLYLDTYYGPQAIHRSLDRVRVYWLNKKINLDEMNKEEQDKAIDKAIASCAFIEHLSAYFKPPTPPLKQTEKEELEELYEYFQKALDEKGWHPEDSFSIKVLYEKYCKFLSKSKEKDLENSLKNSFRYFLALLFNYWNLAIPKTPPFIRVAASQSKPLTGGFLSHAVKTPMSIYACQNLVSTLYEVSSKLKLIDKDSSWWKKIEKLTKNLSYESDLFFLKKDRKVQYAMIQMTVPLLFIYLFYAIQEPIYKVAKQKLDEIKKRPFSFHSSSNNLQCLDSASKKELQAFFKSENTVATLSGALNELLMGIIQDFEHYKEIESLIEKRVGFRFFYLAADKTRTPDTKEAYLKKLKSEIEITDPKQQAVLVIDEACWSFLREGDLFKDFLKGVGDRKLKIIFVGKDKEAVFDTSVLPSNYSNHKQAISLKPSIGELIKSYFEDHPLVSVVPQYRDKDLLDSLFNEAWDDQSDSEKSISQAIISLQVKIKKFEKEAVASLGPKRFKEVQNYTRLMASGRKYHNERILTRLSEADFSNLERGKENSSYKRVMEESKALKIINKRLKEKALIIFA